ncbi:MAG TPA: hypothetical protein VFW65_32720 [Pseudonocardiaceae bacterium]|nr:hypothetical protein [Pseudonocardiaceae bacterium]
MPAAPGTQTIDEGAAPIVAAARATGDGPTGAFRTTTGTVPW